jgi:kinesin family protein C2/C3
MNARSSRAHTVLVLHVRLARGDAVVKSTLHLVDLAGSERLKKSKAEGSRKVEAVGINESLMVLGKVIAALVESRHHVRH